MCTVIVECGEFVYKVRLIPTRSMTKHLRVSLVGRDWSEFSFRLQRFSQPSNSSTVLLNRHRRSI